MTIDAEELEGYEIINYFEDDYQEYWREQIGRSDSPEAKKLVEFLAAESFLQNYGEKSRLYMLVDGESLISYCALTEKNGSGDGIFSPWLCFLHTKEEYRGNGCARKLLEFIEAQAKKQKVKKIYLAAEKTTLFEKRGYVLLEKNPANQSGNQKIMVKKIRKIFGI